MALIPQLKPSLCWRCHLHTQLQCHVQGITTLGKGLEDDIDAVKEQKISFHANAPSKWTVTIEKHRSYKLVYAEGF